MVSEIKRLKVCAMTRYMPPRGFDRDISSIGIPVWLGLEICSDSGESRVLERQRYFGLTLVGLGGPAWLFPIPTRAPAAAVVPTTTIALVFVSHFAGCPS